MCCGVGNGTAFGVGACSGVNECLFDNGLCSQVCVDTYDSYYCTCRQGYRLNQTMSYCPGMYIELYDLLRICLIAVVHKEFKNIQYAFVTKHNYCW